MRVNIDSRLATDPRGKMLAIRVGRDHRHTIGDLFFIWLDAYEARTAERRDIEVDAQANLVGYAEAMVESGLATRLGPGKVRLCGVDDRIAFLLQMDSNSEKGVAARKGAGVGAAPMKKVAGLGSKQPYGQPVRSTGAVNPQVTPLTLTLTPDLDPSLDHKTPDPEADSEFSTLKPRTGPDPDRRQQREDPVCVNLRLGIAKAYPRKGEGTTAGVAALERIADADTLHEMLNAARHYAEVVRRRETPQQFIKTLPQFVANWRDLGSEEMPEEDSWERNRRNGVPDQVW